MNLYRSRIETNVWFGRINSVKQLKHLVAILVSLSPELEYLNEMTHQSVWSEDFLLTTWNVYRPLRALIEQEGIAGSAV